MSKNRRHNRSAPKNPNLHWPKTPQAKALDEARQLEAVAAVAQAGQMITAAGAIPQPLARKMLSDMAQAAQTGMVGAMARTGKGKKKAWEQHAEEYFNSNAAWDEVNGIYLTCKDLLRTSLALAPLLRADALTMLVADKRLLIRNITAITRDTIALAGDLAKIKAKHTDKDSGAKNQLDMAESCMVFSEYVNFMEKYDAALMPLIVHASEQLQEALNTLAGIDPELAKQLTTNLQKVLQSIQSAVHEVTGADAVITPGAEPVAEAAVEQEQAAA